jgi:hypothetical protein
MIESYTDEVEEIVDSVFYESTVYPMENLPKAGIEITEEHRMISLAKEFGIIGFSSEGFLDETYMSFRRIRHALHYGKLLLSLGKMKENGMSTANAVFRLNREENRNDLSREQDSVNRLNQFSVFHLNSLQGVLFDYSKTRVTGIKMLVIRYHDTSVLIQDPVRFLTEYGV